MATRRRSFSSGVSLILVMGIAGSGKTTLSREIIRRTHAVYLDNNHIVDSFFPDTREGFRYEKLRAGFYEALYTIAEANLKLGNSVLLDAPHIKEVQTPEWIKRIRGLAKNNKAKLIVIRCGCTEESLRARIESRGERRDESKLRHWREFLAEQPIHVPVRFPHLEIDTDRSLLGNVTIAVQYITNQSRKRLR